MEYIQLLNNELDVECWYRNVRITKEILSNLLRETEHLIKGNVAYTKCI